MKHTRWKVTAHTKLKHGVADYMSRKLMRDFIAVLHKHRIKGWMVGRKPVTK